MQAIQTRFVGPTDYNDSRIIASCDAKRLVVPWNYALSVEDNHKAAAHILACRLGWTTHNWTSGSTKQGYVHVCCYPSEMWRAGSDFPGAER